MAAPGSEIPRIRVAGLIVIDGAVVTVRHRYRNSRYHLLPGGGVETSETLADSLSREVLEETGLLIRPIRPIFLSDTIDPSGARHVVNVTFLCEITGGEVTERPSDPRVEAVELLSPASLRRADLRPPMGEHIAAFVEADCTGEAAYLGALWTDGDAA